MSTEILTTSSISSIVNATRYMNGIGLVMLIYDHLLTFDDEVRFVWRAKPSFARRAFLINRYLVLVILLVWASFMNNFSNNTITDRTCRGFFVFSTLVGVISIGIANILVLLRVVTLWDRDRRIALLLSFGFFVSFCATFSLMVIVTVKLMPGIFYAPNAQMCILTERIGELSAVWASPMVFEVLVLIFVCWNAFDRPRSVLTPLTRSLARDGIGFFAALTAFRTLNLVLSIVIHAELVVLGVLYAIPNSSHLTYP
ncbi:hypothetical protein EW145_g7948 [Phellinidium pouzarii]|uniref:DUF6533 domain-containing protein n=1 Tax=Phellinidium pouzarii TaxID=167371 RepID=A0A4S4KBT3_9AGAM|nr:hypothetical protein EW145_g7948 [Phellinidium pouzarii]